eukprot:7506905-Pyramimonas_sp.AAC.1
MSMLADFDVPLLDQAEDLFDCIWVGTHDRAKDNLKYIRATQLEADKTGKWFRRISLHCDMHKIYTSICLTFESLDFVSSASPFFKGPRAQGRSRRA